MPTERRCGDGRDPRRTRRPGKRQIASVAPPGNPMTAATEVAAKVTVSESATICANSAVPKAAQTVPDAKTIWLYREQLARAGAVERLFARFDVLLRAQGWLAMGGQIIDATVIEARRPRLTQTEKNTLKGGGTPAEWKPARRAQIDRDGRWTIKRGRKREAAPGDGHQRQVDIAVPVFGYKNHVGIDREFGFLRRYTVTHRAHRRDGTGPRQNRSGQSRLQLTQPGLAQPTSRASVTAQHPCDQAEAEKTVITGPASAEYHSTTPIRPSSAALNKVIRGVPLALSRMQARLVSVTGYASCRSVLR
jgi:hypothetical protein